MELLPLVVVVLALTVTAGMLTVMLLRRRPSDLSSGHDDLRRVGDDPAPSRGEAASRAEGEAAWMRPSGV
ncbi:hypothetical protein ACLKM7_05780 [Microbacterium sp. I2]|uniref:hypothetical protein n=1 Tax=Microbacterium sp. I2 TaxID=3391826 RepID=UPI003EDABCB1